MAITPEGDANPGHATLHAIVTGPTHSRVDVIDAAHIANGDLVVTFDGYTPQGGEIYQLLTAGSVIGSSFRSTELPALPQGLSWNLQLNTKSVTLVVSPRGDFNGNGVLDAADIDQLSTQVRAGTNPVAYDLNNDQLVTDADRTVWVNDLRKTYFGDANLDGLFDSGDFVTVFQAGQYEDAKTGNSSWATGDWNGDADFDSGDFVTAFQAGGYEQGPRAAVQAVPEPTAGLLALPGFLVLAAIRRRR
jgi:MYXO-CTERM domain-containing protein